MERDFHKWDFEKFVKENADQYRMIPSEKVWKGIHSTLHTQRRWYGIALSFLLITSTAITWLMLTPQKNEYSHPTPRFAQSPKFTISNSDFANHNTPNNSSLSSPPAPKTNDSYFFRTSDIRQNTHGHKYNFRPTQSAVRNQKKANQNNDKPSHLNTQASTPAQNEFGITEVNTHTIIASKNGIPTLVTATSPQNHNEAKSLAGNKAEEEKSSLNNNIYMERPVPYVTTDAEALAIRKTKRAKKMDWMLYFIPTISYRMLTENPQYMNAARHNNVINGGSSVVYPSDVNTMVYHRPDHGFQIGLQNFYPLSGKIRIISGLQFSVSKYDIKAYEHHLEVATIALSNRNISTLTKFRNTNGFKENWLHNFYFSASLPVGAELQLANGNKNYFGVAATLQPTYVLDNRAYLISADYKNYAEMPSLIRHMNMNGSMEIFSYFQTGKIKWRVGPQARYQLFSSFFNNYPIKEHLFDFGLKFGVQLK